MDEKELNFYFSHITGPLALFGCVICGTAVISYYIFPKQRKFPNTVLVWSRYLNYLKFLHVISIH